MAITGIETINAQNECKMSHGMMNRPPQNCPAAPSTSEEIDNVIMISINKSEPIVARVIHGPIFFRVNVK